MGLAPQIPAQEGGTLAGAPGQRRVEIEDGLAHAGMVRTVAGCGLRVHDLAAGGDETGSGEFPANPVRRGVHVDLDDDLQAFSGGQFEQHVDGVEAVLLFGRLPAGPVDPAPDRVEAQAADLAEVPLPGFPLGVGVGFEHGCAGLAPAVPDGHGEEVGPPWRRRFRLRADRLKACPTGGRDCQPSPEQQQCSERFHDHRSGGFGALMPAGAPWTVSEAPGTKTSGRR